MKVADATKLRDKLESTFSEWISSLWLSDQATNTYNPATGTTTTTHAVSIAGTGYLKGYRADQIAGEIQAGDVEILWLDGSPEIRPNAKITLGSTTYNVIQNNPVTKSQGIIQRLHCRGINA